MAVCFPLLPLPFSILALSSHRTRRGRTQNDSKLRGSLPNGVPSSETDPLRDGTVLLLRFGKLLLGAERLVALQ